MILIELLQQAIVSSWREPKYPISLLFNELIRFGKCATKRRSNTLAFDAKVDEILDHHALKHTSLGIGYVEVTEPGGLSLAIRADATAKSMYFVSVLT